MKQAGATDVSKRMRFEIGPGGGFLVLIGLLGLSAAVFFLGMISGREMAQSEQGQSQLASVYPMPAGAPAASPPQAAAPAVQGRRRPQPARPRRPRPSRRRGPLWPPKTFRLRRYRSRRRCISRRLPPWRASRRSILRRLRRKSRTTIRPLRRTLRLRRIPLRQMRRIPAQRKEPPVLPRRTPGVMAGATTS